MQALSSAKYAKGMTVTYKGDRAQIVSEPGNTSQGGIGYIIKTSYGTTRLVREESLTA